MDINNSKMPRNSEPKPSGHNEKRCVFCNRSEDNELKYGKIYEHNGIVTHYYCLLLSSNMEQKGADEEGILGFLTADIERELKRGKRLHCSYCKKNGATLGCCNVKCKRIFHYPCGLKGGSLHQFFGEFRSYCVNHRPRSKPEERFRTELKNNSQDNVDNSTCYICLDPVNRNDRFQTIWAPCCKKNAWFHRDCVQQLAMSAGYFFKCPLCNNKTEFQKAMLDRGIFIPCQDASWELVPHAFEELLFRHNRCDAKECLCPKGREYSSSNPKWELILCRTCGSQGIHLSCGRLKWVKPTWNCRECNVILAKNNESPTTDDDSPENSNSTNSSSNSVDLSYSNAKENSKDIITDDEDSDSDISVGVELPFDEISSNNKVVKLRPGPRSFKLKQQKLIKGDIQTSGEGSSLDSVGIRPETTDESDTDETHSSSTIKKPQNKQILDRVNDDIITVDSSDEKELNKNISIVSKNLHENSNNINNIVDINKTIETPGLNNSILVQDKSIVNNSAGMQIQYSIGDIVSNIIPIYNAPENFSLMDIKITNVTSLPQEVFDWSPDELKRSEEKEQPIINVENQTKKIRKPILEIESENEEITYQLQSTAWKKIVHETLGESNLEPQVSGITQNSNGIIQTNTSNDKLHVKKRKMINLEIPNGYNSNIVSPIKLSNMPKKRKHNSYQNGISLENAAVISVLGNDFVVPLDPEANQSTAEKPNYDGDAGSRFAVDTSTSDRLHRCRDDRIDAHKHEREKEVFQLPKSITNCVDSCSYRDTTRLMKEKIRLKDIKFRVGDHDNVKMTIGGTCTIDIKVDTVKNKRNNIICTQSNRHSEETSLASNQQLDQRASITICNKRLRPITNISDDSKQSFFGKFGKNAVKENRAPTSLIPMDIGIENIPNLHKKVSHTHDNQQRDVNNEKIHLGMHKKIMKKNDRRLSLNSSNYNLKNNDIRLRVSIELSKIKSFVKSHPNIFNKHKNINNSIIDNQELSTKSCNFNEKSYFNCKPLKRSKSLGSIPSISTPIKIDNHNLIVTPKRTNRGNFDTSKNTTASGSIRN